MVNLNLKFAKHQIYFSILTKYPENFIGIKQVWPQPQPPRQLAVKLIMDSPDLMPHIWFKAVKLLAFKKLFLLNDIFQIDSCNFPNFMRLFVSNL